MKILVFLFSLLATIFCVEIAEFKYEGGGLSVNGGQSSTIAGQIFMELLKNKTVSIIFGTYHNGTQKTVFFFGAKVSSYSVQGKRYVAKATCMEGLWGTSPLSRVSGDISITGEVDGTAHFSGVCRSIRSATVSTTYAIKAAGEYVKCGPKAGAKRAQALVGTKGYIDPQVINYAIFRYPYLNAVFTCAWYQQNLGDAKEAGAGYVIVGKDGKRCGVMNSEGDKFVHANSRTREVLLTPLIYATEYFTAGYEFKTY